MARSISHRIRLLRKRITQCGPLTLLNMLIPLGGVQVRRGLSYGGHGRQKLDMFLPKRGKGAAPVLIFFYGGRWIDGRRADYKFIGQAFAKAGFVTLIPDYRLHPEVTYPAFIEDGAQVIKWAEHHVAEHGGDPTRMALLGHSAGAHSALILALHRDFLAQWDIKPGHIRAAVGLSGPYDFLPMTDEVAISAFGEHHDSPEGQPITHVHEAAPPLLLIHGLQDTTVSPGNAKRLASALRAEGGHADVLILPRAGHVIPLIALAAPLRWLAPVRQAIVRFLKARMSEDAAQKSEAA